MPNLKADTEIIVVDAIEVGDRSIHPVVRVSALYTSKGVVAASVSPLALVITEPAREYSIDLTGQDLTLDRLMEMSPDLREMIDRTRGSRRIQRS